MRKIFKKVCNGDIDLVLIGDSITNKYDKMSPPKLAGGLLAYHFSILSAA